MKKSEVSEKSGVRVGFFARAVDPARSARKPTLTPPFLTLLFLAAAILAGCASKPAREPVSKAAPPPVASRPGAYHQDDGPGLNPPANLDLLPDASPRFEPLHRFANRPYTVLGRDYVPATELRPYKERGVASWYGRKFHGERTSTGEPYDMYAMTAAHPTLPLPSYARVTNLANGKSAVVRVNDRGPFLHGRIVDLSFAAATKLGYANVGSAMVEVEAILPDAVGIIAARAPLGASVAGATAPATQLPSLMPAAATVSLASSTTLPPVAPPARAGDEPREVPVRSEGSNLYLQLAAFASLDNAENFLTLMEFQLSGAGYSRNENIYAPRIRARDNLFRVEIGPYATRSDAERAAADLESRFGVIPNSRNRQ